MLKYLNTQVTFSEVPDEISLCINITGCKIGCKGCHSSYLAEDIGEELNSVNLSNLIESNEGITCVAFMGGDSSPMTVNDWATYIKDKYSGLKIAWYSGREEISPSINLWNFDYVKIGPYDKNRGPLDKRTTNQVFYRVVHTTTGKSKLFDITNKFWKHETKD